MALRSCRLHLKMRRIAYIFATENANAERWGFGTVKEKARVFPERNQTEINGLETRTVEVADYRSFDDNKDGKGFENVDNR